MLGELKKKRPTLFSRPPLLMRNAGPIIDEERNAEITFFADYNSHARAEAPSIAASDSLSEE